MPIFIPAKIVIIGEYKNAARFVARGQSEMRTLLGDMDQRGLKRSVRRIVPEPGCSIECENVFGQKTIRITVPSVGGGRKEEIVEYLWKVFVHADVMDFSEWAGDDVRDEMWEVQRSKYFYNDTSAPWWLSGDRLTRPMVRSAVSCGVVDIANRKMYWSGSKPHTLLAEQTPSPPTGWEGVAINRNYPDDILPVYDILFPESPFYGQFSPPTLSEDNRFVPSITARGHFVETTVLAEYNGQFYEQPEQLGWGSWTIIKQSTTIWGLSYEWGELYRHSSNGTVHFDYSRTVKPIPYASVTLQYAETVNTRLVNIVPLYFARETPHPYANAPSEYGVMKSYRHTTGLAGTDIHESSIESLDAHPTVGSYYNMPSAYWDVEVDTSYTWGWMYDGEEIAGSRDDFTTFTYHHFYGMMRRYNGLSYGTAPYNATDMLPYLDTLNMWFQGFTSIFATNNDQYEALQTIGNTLSDNYKDSAGNCWFLSSRGGVYSKITRDFPGVATLNIPIYNDTITVRTAMTFAIACGFNIPPVGERGGEYINGAVADLAKIAVLEAGGNVYPNETLPAMIRDDDVSFYEAKTGKKFIRFHTMPGSIYCSPLFNLRVYAYPVKRTTIVS